MQQAEEKLSPDSGILWVIDDLSPAISYRALTKRIARLLCRRISSFIPTKDSLLGPSLLKSSTFHWEEIRFLANCSQEEPLELNEFIQAALRLLEQKPGSIRNGISVPKAMAFGFLASFSEDLPFLISGLGSLLDDHKIVEVRLLGKGFGSQLVRAVADSKGIRVSNSKNSSAWSLGRLNSILLSVSAFWQTRRKPWEFRSCSFWPRTTLFCLGEERTQRYISPAISALETQEESARPLGAAKLRNQEWPGVETLIDSIPHVEAKRLWKTVSAECAEVWRRSASDILHLPHTYRGVRLAPFHFQQMHSVWQERAPLAAMSAELAERYLLATKPQRLVFADPLEFAQVMSTAARKLGILRFSYYLASDGCPMTAGLQEACMHSIADRYATKNEWMRERLQRKQIADAAEIVGDILRPPKIRPEEKKLKRRIVAEKLGLDPQKQWVVILSRSVATTFPEKEKAWLFHEVFGNARKLGYTVIVKGHTYESRAFLEQELAQWNCRNGKVVIHEVDLADILAVADLAVGTVASASNLEAIYARTPLIITGSEGLFAKFDAENGRYAYRKHEAGICLTHGEKMENALDTLLRRPTVRELQVEKALQFAEGISGFSDGLAATRLASWILDRPCLGLRRAEAGDSREIWGWRNDPDTRAMSVNTGEISWEAHSAWYEKTLQNPRIELYLASQGEKKVGICRFDISGDHADVSINLNPDMRGKKLARPLLAAGITLFLQAEKLPLRATVRKENIASNICFQQCGFRVCREDDAFFYYSL